MQVRPDDKNNYKLNSKLNHNHWIAWQAAYDAIVDAKTLDITAELAVLQLFSPDEPKQRALYVDIYEKAKKEPPNISPFLLDFPDENGDTLLIIAVRLRKYNIAQQLIKAGAFRHIKNKISYTASSIINNYDYLFNYLLFGAEFSEKISISQSSEENFHVAQEAFLHWLNELIHRRHHLDLNTFTIQDGHYEKLPILTIAVKNNFIEVVLKLLETGVDPKNKANDDAMRCALNRKQPNPTIINALIAYGAPFDAKRVYSGVKTEFQPSRLTHLSRSAYSALSCLSAVCDQERIKNQIDKNHIEELISTKYLIDAAFKYIMGVDEPLLPPALSTIVKNYVFFSPKEIHAASSKDSSHQDESKFNNNHVVAYSPKT
jgi:hypothetical protein